MESDRDLAFYGNAVLPSDDDEPEDTPQATLKLLGDFPEPLTEPQRRAVQHYVSQQVREFELVRRQVAVVELGYLALLRLVKRLRKEQAKLKASLDEEETKVRTSTTMETTNADPASPPSAPAATSSTVAMSHAYDASGLTKSATTATTTTAAPSKEATVAAKRRPGGLLLRSSVFSGMQRVLQTAMTEQHDAKAGQLARQRERIAKESRMHLVSQDLASQEALFEPLQRRYTRALALGQEAANRAAPLLTLLEDMWRLEALYPSRFSMHAAGLLEPLMRPPGSAGSAGVNGVNEEGGEEAQNDGSADASQPAPADAAAVSFVVPFTPAQYASGVEDAIRGQVEDIIDEYLAYRTRMDPVLYQLEQAQQAAKALKVDQLMDIIGIRGAEAGAEVLPLGATAACAGRASNTPAATATLANKTAEEMLHISSSDDDEDVIGSGVGGATAADTDGQDREQIRTALTALDDFEDA